MAKKKSRTKRMKKVQPSVLTMLFEIPVGNSTIDLSQAASILNRRFYRQGITWAVSGFRAYKPGATEAGAVGLTISKLPNTWTMSNGWEKSFRLWNKQQMEAIEEAGAESAVARFRDFKIHMDVTHVTDGFSNNLLPQDDRVVQQPTPTLVGEWQHSEIVIPNYTADASGTEIVPREFALHAVGAGYNTLSRGIVQGYADSRAYPQSPDPVSPVISSANNWMRDMFDVGSDNSEITGNATDRNDDLPYTQVEYPGGSTQLPGLQMVDAAYFSAGTNSNKLYLKGDTFPCGLVRVFSDQLITLIVDLVPGHHKGYLCQPMQDM